MQEKSYRPLPLVLDLQLFSEGGDMGGGEAGGGEATPPAAPAPEVSAAPPAPQGINPLLDPSWSQAPQAPEAPAAPEMLDFAGRKVPVVDPVIRDLHKDYSNLHKTYQETNNTVRSLQEQNQMFQTMLQQYLQGQPPAAQQTPQAAQPEPEPFQMPQDSESFMNLWYENPITTVQQMVQAQIQQIMEPVRREQQYQKEIQTLSQQYTDFQDHIPQMQELIQQSPQLAEMGLETVYWATKGRTAQPTYTPEQLVNDPNFRQKLVQNETLRNEVVSQYLQQSQERNNNTPPVMGNQPGGNAPAVPENRPKSLREASKMFSKYLGL